MADEPAEPCSRERRLAPREEVLMPYCSVCARCRSRSPRGSDAGGGGGILGLPTYGPIDFKMTACRVSREKGAWEGEQRGRLEQAAVMKGASGAIYRPLREKPGRVRSQSTLHIWAKKIRVDRMTHGRWEREGGVPPSHAHHPPTLPSPSTLYA
jgi:hypothetical protein